MRCACPAAASRTSPHSSHFPPEQVSLADLRARGVLGLRADGALQPFMMTSLPFFDPDGELIGVGNYVTAARAPTP